MKVFSGRKDYVSLWTFKGGNIFEIWRWSDDIINKIVPDQGKIRSRASGKQEACFEGVVRWDRWEFGFVL